MTIYFEKTSPGSLDNIQRDLKEYLESYHHINKDLYKGSDVSISNFVGNVHQNDYFFKKNKLNILIQPIDGTSIQRRFVDLINKFDLIITPAYIGKMIMRNNGVFKPIEVIPNYFRDFKLEENKEEKIVFYHESTLSQRKNFQGLYKSFLYSFANPQYYERVKLVVKSTMDLKEYDEFIKLMDFKYSEFLPEIEFIVDYMEEKELIKLWSRVDCYISFSHMEGFGIPLLNFASMGKPVVTLKSNISGYMNFLDNCYLVPSRLFRTNFDFFIFDKNSEWEDIENYDTCAEILRNMIEDIEKGTDKRQNKLDLMDFHFDSVMKNYKNLIEDSMKGKPSFYTSSVKTVGLKYVSPSGSSGYAEAANNYIVAISDILPTTVRELNFDRSVSRNPKVNELKNKNIGWDKLILHTTPNNWEHLLKEENISSITDKKNVKIIGQTVWETDKLFSSWVNYCNNKLLDEIWVPTKWNKEVFEKSGVKTPIQIVPHIFADDKLADGSIPNIDSEDFVFYTIGQWNYRKGIKETIESFCRAFTSNDKVCLVVKTFASSYDEMEIDRCKYRINNILSNYKNPPKIIYIPDDCSREQILALHKMGDCYFSVCKSEGWGLGAFEAAGYGNPVIITGYGGQTEFFPPDYKLFVEYNVVPVSGMTTPWYDSTQNWAEPIIEDAIDKLKEVFYNPERYANLGKELRKYILSEFGMNSISSKIKKIL